MNFLGRLKYYLIGVGIGILMVLAIFKDRKLGTWTPKNQINEAITMTPIDFTEKLACYMTCLAMDTVQLKSMMTAGNIDFKNSEVSDQNDRNYIIEVKDDHIKKIYVNIKPQAMVVGDLELSGTDCSCGED